MTRNRSDGRQTRQRLLEAAMSIFAAKGFHEAKTADICRMARANVAAINYYFGSKDKLYVESWRYAFERSIKEYPPDGGVSPTAAVEERLRGQILSLMRRIMDPLSLDFDIAHHEMGNPTGLLSEVMRRSIEPLYQGFTNVVRELLGKAATPQEVELCTMSVHSQCFGPLIHARSHARLPAGDRPPVPTLEKIGVETMADHIIRFSLGGIRSVLAGHRHETSPTTKGKTAE